MDKIDGKSIKIYDEQGGFCLKLENLDFVTIWALFEKQFDVISKSQLK